MDGLTLLEEARAAGLKAIADGDRLVIRGPRQANALASRLLEHKAGVLAALNAEKSTPWDIAYVRHLIRDTVERLAASCPPAWRWPSAPNELDAADGDARAAIHRCDLAGLQNALVTYEHSGLESFARWQREQAPPQCWRCRGTSFWVENEHIAHCERCDPPKTENTVAWRYDFGPDPLVEAILAGRTFSADDFSRMKRGKTEADSRTSDTSPRPVSKQGDLFCANSGETKREG